MTFGIAYNVLIVLITFCAVVLISFETGGLLIDGLFVWCLLFVVAFTSFGVCVVLAGLCLVCDLSRSGLLVTGCGGLGLSCLRVATLLCLKCLSAVLYCGG